MSLLSADCSAILILIMVIRGQRVEVERIMGTGREEKIERTCAREQKKSRCSREYYLCSVLRDDVAGTVIETFE